MKKDVVINLVGLIALFVGFALFILQYREIGVFFTLIGIGVYMYNKFKKRN